MESYKIKDYHWENPECCVHIYLFKTMEKILHKFGIHEQAKILDVGCGGGNLLHNLHTKGYEDIWGFDVSKTGITVARKNFKQIQEKFQIHNVYKQILPNLFPQRDYDVVISAEVIEHLYSPKTLLENTNQWLKKGGLLILTTPYHGYWKNLFLAILNKFDSHFSPLWEGGHIKFFSRHTLFSILKKNDFEPLKFYGCGRFRYLWKSMIIVAQKR